MTPLSLDQIQRTIDACREHLVELAESFRTNLDCEIRLSAGEPRRIDDASGLADFQGPGLAVSISLGEQGLIVLIPQTLPLPPWFREPDTTENDRLQTFAQELSLHLLPADLASEGFVAIPTDNLIEMAQSAHAAPTAKTVELAVFHPDGTHDAGFAKILVIVPVTAPPLSASAPATTFDAAANATVPGASGAATSTSAASDQAAASTPSDDPSTESAADTEESRRRAAAASADAALRGLRLLRVPVTVSVRLAERKMSLGAVVALGPGSLVTFSKSCEDLLDLYVNNRRYCQGEAIKIGENFGLKVSKVGVSEERKERII
jgi:flagellar motor switch protein FliN